MEDYPIDFVIPWVDDTDPDWQEERKKCWKSQNHDGMQDGNLDLRFRDWQLLRFWFRGVEKYAPWVHRIYFVTSSPVPKWVNTSHPKLKIIRHADYIDSKYLPVFSSHPIELNFHKIEGLSEHFVYFNDDMFLTDSVKKEDFFWHGLPREMASLYLQTNCGDMDSFQYILFHTMGQINRCFDVHEAIRKNPGKWLNIKYKKHLLSTLLLLRFHKISGITLSHLPSSMKKSTMEEVWTKLEPELETTCFHPFRTPLDINQYIFRYWAILKGEFEPYNPYDCGKEFFLGNDSIEELLQAIESSRYKMICINDGQMSEDFETVQKQVAQSFAKILPERSTFEVWQPGE